MNKRLKLAVLAQAVLDLVSEDDVTEDEIDSALAHLANYPKLLRKLRKKTGKGAWARAIERALGRL